MISSLRSSANPVRARGGMFGAGALTRAVRAPGVWLTFIVALSTLVRGAIATGVPSPWILPDEVVYSELAKSIAAGGFPSVRGVPELGWGVVYPALIAPAWALFDDPARAYHVAARDQCARDVPGGGARVLPCADVRVTDGVGRRRRDGGG